ncbi:TAXI family TRAP transporter solute-binding subunit [Numidum massiliense]|uniref:TAXI family TRAP transporter solute-binding subunit n=1 Tax=Numidum massiliense TaxID=1522315 RepID=UPI0006D53759|nr:TAXI family TRAP transporter solute-binding subunit [Numidum massiliense]
MRRYGAALLCGLLSLLLVSACTMGTGTGIGGDGEKKREKQDASSKPIFNNRGTGVVSILEKQAKDALSITIASGGQSGVYYAVGDALGKLYEQALGVTASVQATASSVENIHLLAQGHAQLALIGSDAAVRAYEGAAPFTKKMDRFQAIAALYPNYVQLVTTSDTGIGQVSDLAGKKVAVGALNSVVEQNAREVLAAFGLAYDDFEAEFLPYAEAVDGLKNGTVDAAFVISGLPNSEIVDSLLTEDIYVVPLTGSAMIELQKEHPYYIQGFIPAHTYRNESDVPTVAIMNVLVASRELDEETVYQLTKTFFSKMAVIQNAHVVTRNLTMTGAKDFLPIPLHPGAERFYKERGMK